MSEKEYEEERKEQEGKKKVRRLQMKKEMYTRKEISRENENKM